MVDFAPYESEPRPPDDDDDRRWVETRRRLDLQFGHGRPWVLRRLGEFFARAVLDRIESAIDMSSNPFRMANEKRATLYDDAPTVSAGSTTADSLSPLDLPRYWALSQHRHLVTNAAGESLVYFDWDERSFVEGRAGVTAEVVHPNRIVARAREGAPDRPVKVEWAKQRHLPDGRCIWTWDIWDMCEGEAPYYAILSADRKTNITREFVKDPKAGTAGFWPRRSRGGVPIFPWVQYHARTQNRLWDPCSRAEIVDGTLNAACLRTWFVGGLRDLAHPQRFGVDVDVPAGANLRGLAEADRVMLDASSVLMFRSVGSSPQLGTLAPAMQPDTALDAIERYNASLLEGDGLGIEPSNTSRMSGYAIVVTRDSLRRVQRQQAPSCREGDRQALSILARMSNAYGGTNLPEDQAAWSVGYHGVERSLEEQRAALETVTARRGAKLMTRRDALITLDPSLSPVEADAKLDEIDAEDAPEADSACSEASDLLEQASMELIAATDAGTVPRQTADRIANLLAQALAALDGEAAGAAPDPGEAATLTDPSSGAPMRTPRGVSAPNATPAD